MGFLGGSAVKNLSVWETQETRVWSLGQEDRLEEEMATHFNILAWKLPLSEEPGGLWSMGLQRVRHYWAHRYTHTHTHTHTAILRWLEMVPVYHWVEKCSKILTVCINVTVYSAVSYENCWIWVWSQHPGTGPQNVEKETRPFSELLSPT